MCPGTLMAKQRTPNSASELQFLKLAYEVRLRAVSAQIAFQGFDTQRRGLLEETKGNRSLPDE